ncbi:MAG: metal-sulfur cluster assembly factor [Chloroflexi bacterium]|nr:MAG: metal-sulfur cluster assembly factor [Chloroflexota bacterium]
MDKSNFLRKAILARLSTIIDPETGADVVRMRLIEDLVVNDDGVARYKFRPSSPLCPIAVSLALAIRNAVAEVDGVSGQQIEVVGYIRAAELNELLRGIEQKEQGDARPGD